MVDNNFVPTIKRVGRKQSTEASIRRGKKFLADKQYDEALATFEAVVQEDPSNAFAHLMLGRLKFRNLERDEALEHFNTASELDPTTVQPYLRSGYIYFQRGELDQARKAFTNALRVNDRSPLAHAAMGFVHLRMDQTVEAIDSWSRALSLNPRMVPVRKRIAMALQKVGRASDAMAQAKAAQRIRPSDPEVHAVTGRLHLFAKQYEQALRCYRKASELDPEGQKPGIRLGLAEACINVGKLDEAQQKLDSVPQREQFSALLHKLWGDLYTAQGLHKEAAEEYQSAMLVSGEDVEIDGFDLVDIVSDEDGDMRWEELATASKRATSEFIDSRRNAAHRSES